MAKPRIFVSSTYYDLKHIRNNLETFIRSMGYEAVLFESGDIPFHHDIPLDHSCYQEIEKSNMQVLVIGGRYGSPSSELEEDELEKIDDDKMYKFYNSITKKEYLTASERGIPIFIFVEKGVLSEYETYKKNRNNKSIEYAHVDSTNVFKLLDEIIGKKTGNYVKGFDNIDDIILWLKDQWAGIFADFLAREKSKIELKDLSSQIRTLESVTSSLREYTEAIMRKLQPEDYQKIIESESRKIINDKANRLFDESLIKHLRQDRQMQNSPLEVFETLQEHSKVRDFINELNIPKEEKEVFLSEHEDMAEYDYQNFRKNYLL